MSNGGGSTGGIRGDHHMAEAGRMSHVRRTPHRNPSTVQRRPSGKQGPRVEMKREGRVGLSTLFSFHVTPTLSFCPVPLYRP